MWGAGMFVPSRDTGTRRDTTQEHTQTHTDTSVNHSVVPWGLGCLYNPLAICCNM